MITYETSPGNITPDMLKGFFVGWPNPPSPEKHLEILESADYMVIAIDSETNRVVGFINAITDNILSVYIPLLEVLPEYQGQGIGGELMRRTLDRFKDFYMIDLICDEKLIPYYKRLGMIPCHGMTVRNFESQPGL